MLTRTAYCVLGWNALDGFISNSKLPLEDVPGSCRLAEQCQARLSLKGWQVKWLPSAAYPQEGYSYTARCPRTVGEGDWLLPYVRIPDLFFSSALQLENISLPAIGSLPAVTITVFVSKASFLPHITARKHLTPSFFFQLFLIGPSVKSVTSSKELCPYDTRLTPETAYYYFRDTALYLCPRYVFCNSAYTATVSHHKTDRHSEDGTLL